MKQSSWGARVAILLVLCAAPACGDSGAGPGARAPVDVPVAAPVAVPVAAVPDATSRVEPESEGRGGGIGLGNFDAGPEAHRIEADAGSSRGKPSNGRLPPEVIQRVVRANFGVFRRCYEDGLRTSPNLQGRATVKFVIDTEGSVTSSVDNGSDMPDAKIVQCIVDEVRKLRFPKPEGGSVTVVYPIIFSPGD